MFRRHVTLASEDGKTYNDNLHCISAFGGRKFKVETIDQALPTRTTFYFRFQIFS